MNNNLAFYENCIWVCVYGWKSRISASLLSFLAFHNGTRMLALDEKEINDMVSVGRRSWWIQFYLSFLFDEKKRMIISSDDYRMKNPKKKKSFYNQSLNVEFLLCTCRLCNLYHWFHVMCMTLHRRQTRSLQRGMDLELYNYKT